MKIRVELTEDLTKYGEGLVVVVQHQQELKVKHNIIQTYLKNMIQKSNQLKKKEKKSYLMSLEKIQIRGIKII